MKAWLITWDWIGEHAKVEDPVVDILSSRISAEAVRNYVERIYIAQTASLREKLEFAQYNSPTRPIYPAEFATFGRRGTYQGRITCGHNPSLLARKVYNLRIDIDVEGNEALLWDETPIPDHFIS